MSDRTNEAWRAYALMIWPKLRTFGREKSVLDDEGKPVLDDDGEPKTERKNLNTREMAEETIRIADTLYAAELAAEERREGAEKATDAD